MGKLCSLLRLMPPSAIFVNTLLGAANWTYKWYQPQGPLSPEELGAQIATVLLAGLRS